MSERSLPRWAEFISFILFGGLSLGSFAAWGAGDTVEWRNLEIRTKSFTLETVIAVNQTLEVWVPLLPEDPGRAEFRVDNLREGSLEFGRGGPLTTAKMDFASWVPGFSEGGVKLVFVPLKPRLALKNASCAGAASSVTSLHPVKKADLKLCLTDAVAPSPQGQFEFNLGTPSALQFERWSPEIRVLSAQGQQDVGSSSPQGTVAGSGTPNAAEPGGKLLANIEPQWLEFEGQGGMRWKYIGAAPEWASTPIYYWPLGDKVEPLAIDRAKLNDLVEVAKRADVIPLLKEALPCLSLPRDWDADAVETFKQSLSVRTGFNKPNGPVSDARIVWVYSNFGVDSAPELCPTPDKAMVESIIKGLSKDIVDASPSWPIQLEIHAAMAPGHERTIATGVFPAVRAREWRFSVYDGSKSPVTQFDLTQPASVWARWLCIEQPSSLPPDPLILNGADLWLEDELGSRLVGFANGDLAFSQLDWTGRHKRCVSIAAKGIFSEQDHQPNGWINITYKARVRSSLHPKRLSLYAGSEALNLSYVSVATSEPVAGLATKGVSENAFVVRAMAPLLGGSLALASALNANLELGANVGMRFASSESQLLTGVTAGVHSALCLKIESKLTPRVCGMVGPDVIFGQRSLDGSTDKYGLDVALSWSILAGAF